MNKFLWLWTLGLIALTLAYPSTPSEAQFSTKSTPIATTTVAGKVKPDGSTITVGTDGTIVAHAGGTAGIDQLTGDCVAGPGSSSQAITCTKINGKALTLGGALTTTGTGSITLAFPNTTQTFTFPTTAKTLLANDLSNIGTGVLPIANLTALPASNFFAGDAGGRPIAASVTGDLGFGTAAAGFVTGTVTGIQGTAISGIGTGVASALAATTNSSTGLIAALTPTNNNCVVGNGSAWTSAACSGGGGGSGTVTSIATTSPITGGTITTTGTIACATCTTSAASLTNHAPVIGAGSQGEKTTAAMTDGQLLIGSTGADPAPGTVAAGTPNLVWTGSAGGLSLATTNAQNSPADGGSHSYTVLSGDAAKEVILASTFTALAVPQATGSFAAGYSFTGVNKGALTATSTTSTINGIAGATGIKLGPNQFSSWDSDGTNWLVGLGVPQCATQTGTTFIRDDYTCAQVGIGTGVSGLGTSVATALAVNVGSAGAVLVKGTSVCADLSNGATGCSTATGTSGATIPLLNGANTWSGVQTVTSGDLALLGSSTGKTTLNSGLASSSNNTLTLPITATDTLAGLGTVQTFSAAQTFGETHGTTYAPTLTSNNYTTQASDCGKTLLFPTGTTPTLTLANINAACTIVVVQNSAVQFTPQAASGGTLNANVNAFTKSKAQNAMLIFTIIVPSASAATWIWSGDGA